ncbi:hypothetical protein [Actinomyces weissii]|uniref:Uncharacterized protein n=1 Tax=Actinomyces weissii TaxID=675090 RepID=A0A7T7S100_9ACTO|nr:hypothetical protein [Actinomyces weissii]QQM66748.1 hypothetical protein JG540_06550 [Actinomyces weissii]
MEMVYASVPQLPAESNTTLEASFLPGVLDKLVLSLLREYPRKTFGFLYANEGETSVADYYIFHDDDRSKEEVARSFESIGEYYRHNSNAGFLATATEVVAENEHRKAMRYRRVAAFHTHLRHPAYFAEVDQ